MKDGISEEQLEKLPKWAGDEIKRLAMRLEEMTAERDALRGEGVSPVFYRDHSAKKNVPLPCKTVCFRAGNDHLSDVTVSLVSVYEGTEHEETRIHVRALHGSLCLEPSAANSIYIKSNGEG